MTGSSKYWGEEEYPDAIYSVYLKKVRYVSPNEGISFNIFFATYRSFSKSEEVLDLIIEWYSSLSDELLLDSSKKSAERLIMMKSTLKSILVCWLDMYSDDFYVLNSKSSSEKDKNEFILIEKLIIFSKSNGLNDIKNKARKLREYFKNVLGDVGLCAQIPSIARVSFSLTGHEPPITISSPISPSNNSKSKNIFDEKEQFNYAKALAESQSRAHMFDVTCDNSVQIAEQLTFWDALLFKQLKIYQCLGSIWGKRHKLNSDYVYSVRATIDQFNSLCQRVMTSIVLPDCKKEFRAQIIEKWINIAKELHSLNNLSSLKAVLSSLQSQPIFRLKNIWSLVSKNALTQLNELSALFESNTETEDLSDYQNDSNNSLSDTLTPKKLSRRTKSDLNMSLETTQGICPYLGTFLTELAMIDEAHSDRTDNGLINFEKRRYEFEVMARLRLYQSAARAYSIPIDQAFCVWFHFLPALDEKECFVRSLDIEPYTNEQQQTPETARRKTREAFIPQMGKINSLSKIFSGLNSSPKELNFPHGNSSFMAIEQQEKMKTLEKYNYYNENNNESNYPSPSSKLLEKPPKSQQRSRSQGSKKDGRYKTTQPSNSQIIGNNNNGYLPQKLSPLIGKRNNNCDDFRDERFSKHLNKIINHSLIQKAHKKSPSMLLSTSTSFASSSLCTPSPISTEPTSSSSGKFSRFPTTNQSMIKEENDYNYPKEVSERKKHFQKSTSSSSSRSSLGMLIQQQQNNYFGGISPSMSVSNCPREEQNFHLVRVGLDDFLQNELKTTTNTNYKCIKVINGDKMIQIVRRALEKHLLDPDEASNYCLVQLLPDGGKLNKSRGIRININ
uniref:Ral guanine nucleotide dissociation stimulator-like 1 n=1 Tax=Meloidogyne hapla TaxID=6305 RepID=A0A1I8BF67_MELHA